jgi:hypothetical protein
MTQAPSRSIVPLIPQRLARLSLPARLRDCPSAVVLTVIVVVTLPSLERVTCDGLKVHVVSAGKPEQAKLLTVPLKPLKL